MPYDKYNEICSQGTQTKLSTANKDDVLVSFTSTCSLLSTTFTQFLLEVSRILHLPLDPNAPLISVDRLLSEFKARSLELHDIDRTELSFHSPLVLPLHQQHSTESTPEHSPGASTSDSPASSSPTTPPCSSPALPHRLPVKVVPAKITKEMADSSTSRITPPLTFTDMSISDSKRSAFCKPVPKQEHGQNHQIKCEPPPDSPPRGTKSETELLDCLQKLQNCYDKYLPASSLPFSLSSLLAKPPVKPEPLKLPDFKLPSNFQFINPAVTDPGLIIKAMQENNPLLNHCGNQPGRGGDGGGAAAPPPSSPLFCSPMKCPYCDLTFHKKSHLSNHLVQLHSHSYHCCRQCKISFPDRQSLEIHQRSHPKQQFQCTGCNLSFKTGSELKRHVKTHTQERAFMCDICGSRFNLKHNLKAHMRQHTGERPFRCKICNRGFTRSNNLKRHLYAHCQDNRTSNAGAAVGRDVLSMVPNHDHMLSMVPNMVMMDSSRLAGVPLQTNALNSEVKVD